MEIGVNGVCGVLVLGHVEVANNRGLAIAITLHQLTEEENARVHSDKEIDCAVIKVVQVPMI